MSWHNAVAGCPAENRAQLRVIPEPHIEVSRPASSSASTFYVGRLRGTAGAVRQLTAIDCYSSYTRADLVVCRRDNASAAQTSALARRVARELKRRAGGPSAPSATTANEYRGERFHETIGRLGARITHIHSGRRQTNGHMEALHRLILEECWRPAFARYLYPHYSGLKRELERYLAFYNHDRVHHRRLTRGRIPADIVYGAWKMEAR